MASNVPPRQIIALRDYSHELIGEIIKSLQVKAVVDLDVLEDVAEFFLRDIYRIDKQQAESISAAKFAGYWAFWIRKLKPISAPSPLTPAGKKYSEARSINEVVCLQFAIEVLMLCRRNADFSDNVADSCKKFPGKCDGHSCIKKYCRAYLKFDDEFYHEYIVYSMRNRTFGPHHFSLLLENITFSSCSGIR